MHLTLQESKARLAYCGFASYFIAIWNLFIFVTEKSHGFHPFLLSFYVNALFICIFKYDMIFIVLTINT